MKIGIIGAMDVEVESLLGVMAEKEEHVIGHDTYYTGKIDGVDVTVVRSGIGKVAAATAAATLSLKFSPDLILNTGVGGSLSGTLPVGGIAVGARAVEHDMDTTPLGDEPGFLSGISKVYLDADADAVKRLSDAARAEGLPVEVGTVASGDRFIASVEEKKRIRDLFPSSIVCEMEGAAIAHAAYLFGTPFVILRAVSDSADGSAHVDFPSFVKTAAEKSYRIVRRFLASYAK